MSVHTLPPTARGGDDFDGFEFAALVADLEPFDLADLFTGPAREHRPARSADRRDAIERSRRGEA